MRSLDVEMLLGPDVTTVDQLLAKVLELAEKKRQRWIEDRRVLEIIANTPLSRQTLEFYPCERESLMRMQVPACIGDTPQFNGRCCLVASERSLCDSNEQLFWGLTRRGEWLLIRVGIDYDRDGRERELEILSCVAFEGGDTFSLIARKAVRHPLQILRGMDRMVAEYQERLKRSVFDLGEELESISYEAQVAEDRADALGWNNEVHGAKR